jgi:hypothetical protein
MGLARLTVVSSQGEADVVCSMLRAEGIDAHDRASGPNPERGGGSGGWREILVRDDQLDVARELLGEPEVD